jgi:gag-polypeptide of LTR copia-type/GAG-pre-integrase domain
MEKLFNTALTDSEPIQGQIDQLKLMVQSLETAGFTLEDKWIVGLIIAKLPESYSTLKTIFSSVNDSQQHHISSNNIIDQILADEACCIRSLGEDATTYFAKASKKGKGRDKDRDWRRDRKTCSHCSHIGHDVMECCKLKKEKEDEKKAKEKAAVTSTSDSGASANSATKAAMARVPTDEVVRLFRATAVEQPYAGIEHVHAMKTTLKADDLHNNWLVDSGASHIMSSCHDWFCQYTPLAKPIKVVLGDNSAIPTVGIGRLFIRMYTGSQWIHAILHDILYIPDLHRNLLSVSHFDRRGHEVCFADHGCQLHDKSKNLICIGHLRGNLYTMDIKVAGTKTTHVAHIDEFPLEGMELSDFTPTAFANMAHADLATWHRRFGHMHTDAITHMLEKGMVTGMKLTSNSVTITDLWTVTYVFPSYRSDPDSLPTQLDCHKVTYAD